MIQITQNLPRGGGHMLKNMHVMQKIFGVELSDLSQPLAYFAQLFVIDLKWT